MDDSWMEKDEAGSGYGLMEVLFRYLRRVTVEKHQKETHVSQCSAEIRIEHLPNASLWQLQIRQPTKL
jgi:hypothetical protein